MTKFTKGPWAVNPVSAHVDVMVEQPDGSVVPVPICALLWPTDERSEDETEANAWLIAKAPELFDIVNAVAHIGVDFGHGEFDINTDHIAKARELIAEITEPKR